MKYLLNLLLVAGLAFLSGCNSSNQEEETAKVEPICLQRLEAAIGEVRKLSDSLTSGITKEEIRQQSNQAVSALRDAVDLFQVKEQSSKPLGVDDLGKLVDEWAFFLSLASQQKYQFEGKTAVMIWTNGYLGNTLDENSQSLSKVSKPRMSFYQWQRVARRWPQTKSLLYYYNRKNKETTPLPENVADELIAYEITPYPEGEKKFFEHFKPKYGPDKYCWSWEYGGDREEHTFEMSMPLAQFDQLIISEIGKEARELDLKIKALL